MICRLCVCMNVIGSYGTESVRCYLEQRFALRFIHSHSDATGVLAMHSWEIVGLPTSGNHVRHFVPSQDDAFAELMAR